jgi:alpha-glucosidase
MKLNHLLFSLLLIIVSTVSCTPKSEFVVSSPAGNLKAVMKFNPDQGTITYSVTSRDNEIILPSRMGINTDAGDFSSGMKLKKAASEIVDEVYPLPQGKVSNYHNRANEQIVTLRKGKQSMDIRFRVYDDGVAFRYEIPGEGEITIHDESSTVHLAGENFNYWGQPHPNRYGYESALGPIEDELISIPVLAELKDRGHFVLIGQAATNGHYIQPHFKRTGSVLSFCFPGGKIGLSESSSIRTP